METLQGITVGTETAAPVQPERTQPERTQERPQERPKRTRTSAYDKAGLSIAYVFSCCLSLLLWFAGAYFTIAALNAFGLHATGAAWWLLPVGITAIELWLMPRAGTRWQAVAFFVVVLIIDILSSWYGVLDTMGGRFVPLGAGFTIPKTGAALHIGAIMVSLIFAFMPEKLARWSIAELWKVWR